MDALSLFNDQFRHMAWADAMIFSTITDNPMAVEDEYLLAKLRHLHAVQRIFLDVWSCEPLDPGVADDLDLRDLAAFARGVHQESMCLLEALTPAELENVIELPWSKTVTAKRGFTVAEHTLAETLAQLPALGVDPHMNGFIARDLGSQAGSGVAGRNRFLKLSDAHICMHRSNPFFP